MQHVKTSLFVVCSFVCLLSSEIRLPRVALVSFAFGELSAPSLGYPRETVGSDFVGASSEREPSGKLLGVTLLGHPARAIWETVGCDFVGASSERAIWETVGCDFVGASSERAIWETVGCDFVGASSERAIWDFRE
jgi:hypothetical protein